MLGGVMYGYDLHRNSVPSNRNMIQLQMSHPPLQDTRPKTTHITSSLSRNFPLHKSAYYRSYKYNVLNNTGRLVHQGNHGHTAGQKGTSAGQCAGGGNHGNSAGQCAGGQKLGAATRSTPNFNSVAIREQVSFPMWTKPFRPKQSTAYLGSRKVSQPSHLVLHTKTPVRVTTRTQTKEEDLPPIVNLRRTETRAQPPSPTTPPPIRVTFNYLNRSSETPSTDQTGSDTKDTVDHLTLQRYAEFLRFVGHADLTHNSYIKVENWLAELEKDGTWPVQWFASKIKR